MMTQPREKLVTFARPMTISIGMETITLSYEPGSDFAKKLDELIRNSEGVRVVKSEELNGLSYQQEEDLRSIVKERIRQLEEGEVKTIPNEQVFAEIRERYGF